MKIDRTRFLTLAFSLAATTAVASTGCSSSPEETESGTGALAEAGGVCGPSSIKKPGEGSMSFFAYQEGYCFDLARHFEAPDAEGIEVRWSDFVYDQCRAYSQQLQPAVAKRVQACLTRADEARPRNASGRPAVALDALAMYECGRSALFSICSQGIDGRVRARAERIALLLKQEQGDSRPLATIQQEVKAVLSGFKSAARAQLESCVTEGYDLYACVEGMSVSFAQDDLGEPDPSAAEACVPAAEGNAPAADACDAVLAKVDAESRLGAFAVRDFAESQCKTYLKYFTPAAARAAIACLTDPSKKTYENIYTCGAGALKSVCPDPASVDATCRTIVDAITAVDRDANRGGRITRQCRTLLPGLDAAARERVKTQAPEFARFIGGQYAFYACIEALE